MRKINFVSYLTLVLILNSAHASVLLTNPPSYSKKVKCSVYAVTLTYNHPRKLTEVIDQEAVKSEKDCSNYVKRHFGSGAYQSPLCGYSTKIFPNVENQDVEVMGVLEKPETSFSVFKRTVKGKNVFKVTSPQTSIIAGSPTKCTEKSFSYRVHCDYEKSKICVKESMPFLSQKAEGLPAEISKFTKNPSITVDAGWCAAVSTTMALLGSINRSNYEFYKPEALWKKNIPDLKKNNKLDLNARTVQYASTIYEVGNIIGTRWVEGGTDTVNGVRKLFAEIDADLRNVDLEKNTTRLGRNFYNLYPNFTYDMVVDKVQKKHSVNLFGTAQWEQVCSHTKTEVKSNTKNKKYRIDYSCGTETPYERLKGSHIMALNGVEEGYLKIYDSVGRIFNVRMDSQHPYKGIDKSLVTLERINENGGYVKKNAVPSSFTIEAAPGVDVEAMIAGRSKRIINTGYLFGYENQVMVSAK